MVHVGLGKPHDLKLHQGVGYFLILQFATLR